MKNLISVFTLILLLFASTDQAMARDYKVGSLSVRGISKFSGPYVSLYLVHGSKLFGQEITVNKVFKVLKTQKINGSDEMVFGPFSMKQNWSSFRGPSHVIAVIHSEKKHALNRHGVIDGTPTVFEAPNYLNSNEVVPANNQTKKLEIRGAISLKDLKAGVPLNL